MICKYGNKITTNWEEAKIDAKKNNIKTIEMVKDDSILTFKYDENKRIWKIIR